MGCRSAGGGGVDSSRKLRNPKPSRLMFERQNIDEAPGVEVHDPGHQQRGVLDGRRQERGLVRPDRARGTQTGQVTEPGPAVVAHRSHGRVPRHP
jgi:hypothetical protein